jgi:hypothetical protein
MSLLTSSVNRDFSLIPSGPNYVYPCNYLCCACVGTQVQESGVSLLYSAEATKPTNPGKMRYREVARVVVRGRTSMLRNRVWRCVRGRRAVAATIARCQRPLGYRVLTMSKVYDIFPICSCCRARCSHLGRTVKKYSVAVSSWRDERRLVSLRFGVKTPLPPGPSPKPRTDYVRPTFRQSSRRLSIVSAAQTSIQTLFTFDST